MDIRCSSSNDLITNHKNSSDIGLIVYVKLSSLSTIVIKSSSSFEGIGSG